MVKRWLRRGTALVLAAVTLVTVAAADDSTPDGGSAAKWLLRWTLGSWLPSDGLSPATALVLGQSPLLLSARSDVADFTAGQQDTLEEPETEQEQEPDTPAVNPQTPLPASPRTALAFQDNGVPSQTVKITNTAGYTVVRGVCIKNGSNKTLDADTLAAEGFAAQLTGDAPQVLILHTHATETYQTWDTPVYDPDFTARTKDTTLNMCAVGEAMTKVLNDAGITTLHDTTLHDSPSYTESYARSAQTARRYLEEYPSIKVVLDVHRDAMESGDARVRPLTTLDGQPTAQVMIIAGCNNGGTVQLPNWRLNLCFAAKWEERMEMLYPGLTRPVLCGYRFYNQDVSPGALLIEIGGHANTVQQAVRAGQYAAKALAALFDSSV